MAYVLLALAGVVPAMRAFARRRDPALIATFFLAGGLIMLADWIAYGWFRLYDYQPGLVRSALVDSMLGEWLAETLFVAALSVALVVYTPGWRGVALGTTLVAMAEETFSFLGVFSRHGWPVWATAAAFPFYFLGNFRFWRAARKRSLKGGWPRQVARAGVGFWLVAMLTAVLRLTGLQITNLHVMPTHLANQSLGRFLTYGFSATLGCYWCAAGEPASRPVRVLLATALAVVLNYVFIAAHIQFFLSPYGPVSDGVAQGIIFGAACLIDNWIEAAVQEEARAHA